jgi:hypothetical protein
VGDPQPADYDFDRAGTSDVIVVPALGIALTISRRTADTYEESIRVTPELHHSKWANISDQLSRLGYTLKT